MEETPETPKNDNESISNNSDRLKSPTETRQETWRVWIDEEFEKQKKGQLTEDELKDRLAEKLRQTDDELTKQFQIAQSRAELLNTDELSEIPGKYAFDNDIDELVKNKERFGLLMLDIDKFRDFNGKYGHMGADQTIKHIAQTIDSVLRKRENDNEEKRPEDTVYRLHGDETAILVRGITTPESLLEVSERVRNAVLNSPATINGVKDSIPISTSIGGAIYDGQDTDDFIDMVDKGALYGAKNNGRNNSYIMGIHDHQKTA